MTAATAQEPATNAASITTAGDATKHNETAVEAAAKAVVEVEVAPAAELAETAPAVPMEGNDSAEAEAKSEDVTAAPEQASPPEAAALGPETGGENLKLDSPPVADEIVPSAEKGKDAAGQPVEEPEPSKTDELVNEAPKADTVEADVKPEEFLPEPSASPEPAIPAEEDVVDKNETADLSKNAGKPLKEVLKEYGIEPAVCNLTDTRPGPSKKRKSRNSTGGDDSTMPPAKKVKVADEKEGVQAPAESPADAMDEDKPAEADAPSENLAPAEAGIGEVDAVKDAPLPSAMDKPTVADEKPAPSVVNEEKPGGGNDGVPVAADAAPSSTAV